MDCPRALQRYGGDRPEVGLFDDRPDALPRALCFPGGHSSGGFSFLALYFLLGERRRAWRWAGLAAGLGLGFSFAGVQWARGQHFVSHDLVSAAIGWAVALGAYTVLYRSSVWNMPGSGRDAPAAD
jgi:membrane-associated PAP2 superfamily phosphatase